MTMTPPPPPADSIPATPTPAAVPATINVVQRGTGLGRITLGFMLAIVVLGTLSLVVFFVGVLFGGAVGAGLESGGAAGLMVTDYRDGNRNHIAILPVEGVIDARKAAVVHAAVETILDDNAVKAVVLRVDSPGGGVTASDQIWYDIERLKTSGRPVVASFGGVAASGGYYVSAGADHIMAEVTCTTGSIGVIAQVLTLGGLMDMAGVEPITLVARNSPNKSVANDTFREWSAADRDALLTILDDAYATFNERVRTGRATAIPEPADVDALADGSVYTARAALANGLIDSIGYLDDAIAEAERQAKLAVGSARVRRIDRMPSLFDGLPRMTAPSPAATGGFDVSAVRGLVDDLTRVRIKFLGPIGS